MLARASIRRCQRSLAVRGLAATERGEGDVVAEGDAVQQRLPGRGEARRRRPAARLHDLVAAGDQPPHRLDREQVAGARLAARPSRRCRARRRSWRGWRSGAPRRAQAVELAQRLLGLAGVADDAEAAALAAADRPAPGPAAATSQPKSGSPQAGQGGFSGPAPASSGTTGVLLCVVCAACAVAYGPCAAGAQRRSTFHEKGLQVGAPRRELGVGGPLGAAGALATFARGRPAHRLALLRRRRQRRRRRGGPALGPREQRLRHARRSMLQALGFALLAVPLVYLFRAVAARSDGCAPS